MGLSPSFSPFPPAAMPSKVEGEEESREEIGPRRRFFSFHFIFNLFRFPFGKKRRRERSGEKRRKREFLGEILPGKQKKESWGRRETEPIGGRRGKSFSMSGEKILRESGRAATVSLCDKRSTLVRLGIFSPLA